MKAISQAHLAAYKKIAAVSTPTLKKPKMVAKKCPACMGKGTIPGSYLKCKECAGEGSIQTEYTPPVPTKCPGCGEMVTTKSGFCPSCNRERNNARYSSKQS